MTPLSQTILDTYQVRKSGKDKLRFIELLRSHIPESTVQSGGFPKNHNLIVGNVETAKILLTAHYDTCAWLPVPNFIAPKKPLLSILYSLVMIVPMVIIIYLVNLLLRLLGANFWGMYWISLAVWFGLLALMMFGPANRHTANDNTSGVITLCEIYASLSEAEKAKVALVFFDNEENGLFGSSYFRKQYKKQLEGKLLINFDCVSDGDHLLLAISKAARQDYQAKIAKHFVSNRNKHFMLEKAEKVYYPSDQAGFKQAIAVAALKRIKCIGYYLDRIHTHRDTVFDEENILLLRDCTLSFINEL